MKRKKVQVYPSVKQCNVIFRGNFRDPLLILQIPGHFKNCFLSCLRCIFLSHTVRDSPLRTLFAMIITLLTLISFFFFFHSSIFSFFFFFTDFSFFFGTQFRGPEVLGILSTPVVHNLSFYCFFFFFLLLLPLFFKYFMDFLKWLKYSVPYGADWCQKKMKFFEYLELILRKVTFFFFSFLIQNWNFFFFFTLLLNVA